MPDMEARAFGKVCLLKACESVVNAVRYYGDPRARFTLAHEFGHLVLSHPGTRPRHRPEQQGESDKHDIFEIEANIFASEFLMPTDLIDPSFTAGKISQLFQVSPEAAALRKKELDAAKSRNLPAIRRMTTLVPIQTTSDRVAFVSMAYSPDHMTRLYHEIIRPAVEAAGLTCLRADEISSVDTIINDIRRAIDQCELVIAEISQSNLNVVHEIGLAQSIDKPVIIICNSTCNDDQVPSNIRSLRRIIYSNDAGGGPMLRRDLEQAIKVIVSTRTPAR